MRLFYWIVETVWRQMWDFRDNEQHFCLQINSSNHPPPLENTCCKQNNVLMSLKPSICSMVIFSQADWYALSILFGILPALIRKRAQVITTCLYTHSCRHLPKDYWNETNDLNNNNCENRKKEEKKHFCFGGANRNAYVLNTSMNWALPSGSSGT